MANTHQTAKTQYVSNGDVKYAYRRFGKDTGVPLLFLMHCRGTMDFWDPLLVNKVAESRPVILFDNAGVGQSTGEVATTITGMAQHAIDLLKLINVPQVDVLGFSMGGYVTPLVYLNGPSGLVKKLIISGSGPSYGEGLVAQSDERSKHVGELASGPSVGYDNGVDRLFFGPDERSQAAGRAWWKRIHERDVSTSGEARSNLVSSDYADDGAGMKALVAATTAFNDPVRRAEGGFDRLGDVKIPVLIGQGHDYYMIPTQRSYVMQQKLPNARLKIFPFSGHGFLYQYAEEWADDVAKFLDGDN